MLSEEMLQVSTLGPSEVLSPLTRKRDVPFVDDRTRVRLVDEVGPEGAPVPELTFEKAGPRKRIFFEPENTTAAVVTCGGLSPGLNNVIRSVFMELRYNYGVRRVLGIRDGFRGLNAKVGKPPVEITPDFVRHIHYLGGTVLGTSRGPQEPKIVVDFLERYQVDILFCLGGDGTQRGAHALHEEIERRNLKISLIGVPKTIDNDVQFVAMTFGYQTALQKAEEVLRGAHVEASCAPNGIALVKLMGREAGFIAAGAALASQEANFVLVPEVPFPLDGPRGLLTLIEERISQRGHALIVVAEGAGQHLFEQCHDQHDASGNARYHDIGFYLRDQIKDHFAAANIPINLKYIDPSYVIRSVPANTWDRILCDEMGRSAVHAGMAGKTDAMIGMWGNNLIHVPIGTAVSDKKQMNLADELWTGVLSATGQPRWS